MTDATFVQVPTAHTDGSLSTDYTSVDGILSAAPTAHTTATLSVDSV